MSKNYTNFGIILLKFYALKYHVKGSIQKNESILRVKKRLFFTLLDVGKKLFIRIAVLLF